MAGLSPNNIAIILLCRQEFDEKGHKRYQCLLQRKNAKENSGAEIRKRGDWKHAPSKRRDAVRPSKRTANADEDRNEDIDNSGSLGNLRDQGFTRPRVLVLLPVRATAETFIARFCQCQQPFQHNEQKFHLEFGLTEEEDEKDEMGRRKLEYNRDGNRKPEDWIELFAKNNDDAFE